MPLKTSVAALRKADLEPLRRAVRRTCGIPCATIIVNLPQGDPFRDG